MKAKLIGGPRDGLEFDLSEPVPQVRVPELPDVIVDLSDMTKPVLMTYKEFAYNYVGTANDGTLIYRHIS